MGEMLAVLINNTSSSNHPLLSKQNQVKQETSYAGEQLARDSFDD
jgi:hypothetical protein